jgi:putative PIN family toxin of toxin-antitoxin system
MIQAVLDTNVLLSALRSRNGASFEIMDRFDRGEFILLLSNTVLAEYEEVLKRELPSLGFSLAAVDAFLDELCLKARLCQVSAAWKPSLPDADDEAIAQLAIEVRTDYLVTHNVRHFPPDRLVAAARVVEPRTFLNILRTSP